MKEQHNLRRGTALGVATLTALSATVMGVVGASEHADLFAQRDVALVNAADDAHLALVQAQADQNTSYFDSQVVGLQQSIYYWGQQNDFANLLFPGNPDDPATSLFNGAFTRFSEAAEVSQAMMQVQWDHLLGVNQTAGIGDVPPGSDGGSPGGYETVLAQSFYSDFAGSGIDPDSSLGNALAAFAPGEDFTSYSGFVSDLSTLQSALLSTGFADLLGMFSVGGGDAGDSVADLFGLF